MRMVDANDCRWTSAIVALPIALYTSYILYDRSMFFPCVLFLCPRGVWVLANVAYYSVWGSKDREGKETWGEC